MVSLNSSWPLHGGGPWNWKWLHPRKLTAFPPTIQTKNIWSHGSNTINSYVRSCKWQVTKTGPLESFLHQDSIFNPLAMITVRLQARWSTVVCVCARQRVYAWYLHGGPLAVIGFRVPCHSTDFGVKSQLPIYMTIYPFIRPFVGLTTPFATSRDPHLEWICYKAQFAAYLVLIVCIWHICLFPIRIDSPPKSCIISTAWSFSEPCHMQVSQNRRRFTHSNTSTMEGNPHLSPS